MSIVSVTELPSRQGEMGMESVEKGWFWKRTYQRVFLVLTSSKWDEVIAVRNAVDPNTKLAIPVVGDVYTNNGLTDAELANDWGAYAQTIECEEGERVASGGSYWTVTVNYGPYDPAQNPENPFQRPIEIAWSNSVYQAVVFQDNQGNPILNSAGDAFDPPMEADDDRPMLTITRAEPTYDPILTYNYRSAVNADEFWGFPPGVWKMKDRRGTRTYNPDAQTASGYYWEVTYEFELNPLGWTRQILDQGLKVAGAGGGSSENATDGAGDPAMSPILLDGKGGKLAAGQPPVFLSFDIFNVLPYDVFGLFDPDGGN